MSIVSTEGKQGYTISDIAGESGASKTTASRAISGKGRLRTETKVNVLDFIKKHNCRPAAAAKSPALRRTL